MKIKFHDPQKWHHVLILVVMGMVMIPAYTWALNTISTGYRTTTSNQVINGHGVCQQVRHTSGLAAFVPTKTSAEWAAFRANAPSNVALSSCPLNCRVGYQFRNDPALSPVRYTPYTGTGTTTVTGAYSVTTSGAGDDDRTCDEVGCGINASVQCSSGPPIRIGYQYRLDSVNSPLRYTPFTSGTGIAQGALSTVILTNDFQRECASSAGGCNLRMFVDSQDPAVSCSITYRHQNRRDESPYASNGEWATIITDDHGGEECNSSPGCGLQVRLQCNVAENIINPPNPPIGSGGGNDGSTGGGSGGGSGSGGLNQDTLLE